MREKIAEIEFKTSFFSKKKRLVFSNDDISLFKGKVKAIQLRKDDINACRIGVYWLGKIDFYTGSIFRIELRDKFKKSIKIKLLSPYGINDKVLRMKYSEIVSILFDIYFSEKIDTFIHRIEGGEKIEIAGTLFTTEGVFLEPKKNIVLWHDLKVSSDKYYYTLASKQDSDIFKFYKYFTDWNALFVSGVSRGILRNKGLYKD